MPEVKMSQPDLLADYAIIVPIAVAWGDMDAYQHVNNVVYLRWFETARIAYFLATQVVIEAGMPQGVGPILATATCRFRAPVTFPDDVRVGIRVSTVDRDRFTMEYAVASERLGRLAATGDGIVVSVDYATGKKAPLPEAWRQGILRVEGEMPPSSKSVG